MLDRRFGTLGFLDHGNDLGKHGICAHARCTDQQCTRAVDRAAGDGIAHGFLHGDGFACDHGFVNMAGAFQHVTINRQALTGANNNHVANDDFGDRNLHILAITPHPCRGWGELHQLADDCRCPALGGTLHQTAHQDKRDDDGGGLEIGVCRAVRKEIGGQKGKQGVTEGGRGADRDQAVHARREMAQLAPGQTIEQARGKDLHGKRQEKFHGHPAAVTHDPRGPVLDGTDMTPHGEDDEGSRENRCNHDSAAQSSQGGLTACLSIVFFIAGLTDGPGGVAGSSDRFDDRGVVERTGKRGDPGAMGRKIDLGKGDAGHRQQRRFNTRDTATAGHALDGVVAFDRGRLISKTVDRGAQGCSVRQDLCRHRCAMGGEVDFCLVDAVDPGQRAFDLGDTAAAGHAVDREVKMPGHRYLRTSMSSATMASSSPRLAAVTT